MKTIAISLLAALLCNAATPSPLVLLNGQQVTDAKTWTKLRRPEILRLFEDNVHGHVPQTRLPIRYETVSVEKNAFGGRAIRKQITVHFSKTADGPKMHMLIYAPAKSKGKVAAFLGLNFDGNHTVHADPGIRLAEVWRRDNQSQIRVTADESTRGSAASQWQVEKIIKEGFALVTIYRNDIEPDFATSFPYSVRALLQPAANAADWGAIGAWAWGLSRALDYLEKEPLIDSKKVAVFGHSRLGKAAMWAAAQDQRFAMAISNNSGQGGVALAHRKVGETIEHLNTAFPHWFSGNYKKFTNHQDDLPVDGHLLIALVAPRPAYVASAQEDNGADPQGEFEATAAAGEVYELFGKQGLAVKEMPLVHDPIMNTLGYHIRAGKHDVTAFDWEQYLKFATKQLR